MSNTPGLTGSPFNDEHPTFTGLLWEAHEVLACLSDLFQHSNGRDIEIEMSDSGRKGLGRILRHCEQLTIDAIGIAPADEKRASHE